MERCISEFYFVDFLNILSEFATYLDKKQMLKCSK